MGERSITLELSRRQVTMIITVIALAAILVPVGVDAATGSSVNITDPSSSSRKARVTSGYTLATGVCDPFTVIGSSSCARVAGGKLKVGDGSGAMTVDGTVDVGSGFVYAGTDIPPTVPLWSYFDVDTTAAGTLETTPFEISESAALTSATVANTGTDPFTLRIQSHTKDSGDCNGAGTFLEVIADVQVPAGETVHLSFPQPLVAPKTTPTDPWCIDAGIQLPTGSPEGTVTLVGYLV